MTTNTQILRTLDKADRMKPEDVFDLLTGGRVDKSGARMSGCGLSNAQAVFLAGFVFSQKEPRILSRLRMIETLESVSIDGSDKTAWDIFLDEYGKLPEPKNIAWVIDDIVDALKARHANATA